MRTRLNLLTKLILAGWLIMVIFVACDKNETPQPQKSDEQVNDETPEGRTVIKIGDTKLFVEVVQNDEERMQGLMHREELPEKEGMLFVFSDSRIQSFWMRNTFIPLDIAFIDSEGKIIDIQQMEPLDETKRYTSPGPVPYVLEVNQGWFEQNKIKVGDKVQF